MTTQAMEEPSASYLIIDDDNSESCRVRTNTNATTLLTEDDIANLTPVQTAQEQNNSLSQPYVEDSLVPSVGYDQEDDDDGMTPLIFRAEDTTTLNGLNYLNVVTYLVSVFCSWGLGVWGLDHLIPTRWETFNEYETLVTPAGWTYNAMWAPILLWEGFFAIGQCFPRYRSRPIIQDGTSYWFFYTCLGQIAWTLCFGFRCFPASFASVVLTCACLAGLLARQHWTTVRGTEHTQQAKEEYILFRFPFHLHFGWVAVQAAVHFALLIRHAMVHNHAAQLSADIVALSILLPVASFFLLAKEVNFVIPMVILWSYIGIGSRLTGIMHNPADPLLLEYGILIVASFRSACWFFCGIIGFVMLPRALMWICHEFFTIQVVHVTGGDSFTLTSRDRVRVVAVDDLNNGV